MSRQILVAIMFMLLLPAVGSAGGVERVSLPGAILVVDPGLDPRGEPQPVLSTQGDELVVEIPPTIHIHRYYPSGPKEFQAQFFAGGPTLVSVRHPYDDRRVNVRLDLPPGYPVVEYDWDTIKYKYPEETFTIRFHRIHGEVTTSYNRLASWKAKTQEKKRDIKAHAVKLGDDLGVNSFACQAGQQVLDITHGTLEVSKNIIGQAGNAFLATVNLVPGAKRLRSDAANRFQARAMEERDAAVGRASAEAERLESQIPTLR